MNKEFVAAFSSVEESMRGKINKCFNDDDGMMSMDLLFEGLERFYTNNKDLNAGELFVLAFLAATSEDEMTRFTYCIIVDYVVFRDGGFSVEEAEHEVKRLANIE